MYCSTRFASLVAVAAAAAFCITGCVFLGILGMCFFVVSWVVVCGGED